MPLLQAMKSLSTGIAHRITHNMQIGNETGGFQAPYAQITNLFYLCIGFAKFPLYLKKIHLAQDKESFSHEYNYVILRFSFFWEDGQGALGEVVLKVWKAVSF